MQALEFEISLWSACDNPLRHRRCDLSPYRDISNFSGTIDTRFEVVGESKRDHDLGFQRDEEVPLVTSLRHQSAHTIASWELLEARPRAP